MVARDDKLSSASLILLKIHILIVRFKVSDTNRDNVFLNRRPRESHHRFSQDKNEETRIEIELREKSVFKTYKTDKTKVG